MTVISARAREARAFSLVSTARVWEDLRSTQFARMLVSRMKSTRRKAARNGAPLRQVAALPFRVTETGGVEVLVLTTRQTRRFTLPKGWIDRRRKAWKSAAQEAEEEAGVAGRVKRKPIGTYTYWKRLADHFALVEVEVYPLKVEKFLKRWPERRERFRRWLPARDAALLIDEPQLHHLVETFGKGTANARLTDGAQHRLPPDAVSNAAEVDNGDSPDVAVRLDR